VVRDQELTHIKVQVASWQLLMTLKRELGERRMAQKGHAGLSGTGHCGSAAVQGLVNEASLIASSVVSTNFLLGACSTSQHGDP
jgi:hypothetical protein